MLQRTMGAGVSLVWVGCCGLRGKGHGKRPRSRGSHTTTAVVWGNNIRADLGIACAPLRAPGRCRAAAGHLRELYQFVLDRPGGREPVGEGHVERNKSLGPDCGATRHDSGLSATSPKGLKALLVDELSLHLVEGAGPITGMLILPLCRPSPDRRPGGGPRTVRGAAHSDSRRLRSGRGRRPHCVVSGRAPAACRLLIVADREIRRWPCPREPAAVPTPTSAPVCGSSLKGRPECCNHVLP